MNTPAEVPSMMSVREELMIRGSEGDRIAAALSWIRVSGHEENCKELVAT